MAAGDGGWCALSEPGVGAQAGHLGPRQPDERRHGGRLTVDWDWQGTRPVILSGLEWPLPETRLPKCGLGVFPLARADDHFIFAFVAINN